MSTHKCAWWYGRVREKPGREHYVLVSRCLCVACMHNSSSSSRMLCNQLLGRQHLLHDTIFYLPSRLRPLRGQSVPEIKKWCCGDFANRLWKQSSPALLSIQTDHEARNMTQWTCCPLNLVQKKVERREVTEKIFSCIYRVEVFPLLQLISPTIYASILHIKVISQRGSSEPLQPHLVLLSHVLGTPERPTLLQFPDHAIFGHTDISSHMWSLPTGVFYLTSPGGLDLFILQN